MSANPRVIIIAGPNGAGKTTFAREFLPNEAGCPIFVNADLIAARYKVKLLFLQLKSAEEAIARVAQRVRQGGHNIPEAVIRRRFAAGRANFGQLYAPKVDAWAL
jgi:predicted ABC-type ATPase